MLIPGTIFNKSATNAATVSFFCAFFVFFFFPSYKTIFLFCVCWTAVRRRKIPSVDESYRLKAFRIFTTGEKQFRRDISTRLSFSTAHMVLRILTTLTSTYSVWLILWLTRNSAIVNISHSASHKRQEPKSSLIYGPCSDWYPINCHVKFGILIYKLRCPRPRDVPFRWTFF